jgi:hypothetical protein
MSQNTREINSLIDLLIPSWQCLPGKALGEETQPPRAYEYYAGEGKGSFRAQIGKVQVGRASDPHN